MTAGLEGQDDPDHKLAQAYPNHVQGDPDADAPLDLVDDPEHSIILVFPLVVEETAEDAHEVGGGSDVWLEVEVIHEFRLGFHARVGNRVAPVIHHYQHEGTDDRRQEERKGDP